MRSVVIVTNEERQLRTAFIYDDRDHVDIWAGLLKDAAEEVGITGDAVYASPPGRMICADIEIRQLRTIDDVA